MRTCGEEGLGSVTGHKVLPLTSNIRHQRRRYPCNALCHQTCSGAWHLIDSEQIAARPLAVAPETAPELEAFARSHIRIIFPRFADET